MVDVRWMPIGSLVRIHPVYFVMKGITAGNPVKVSDSFMALGAALEAGPYAIHDDNTITMS